MGTASSTFTELVSTTFRNHKKDIKDNVSNRNALVKRLMMKGNYETQDGGYEIVLPLDYAENGTYQRYTDWDTLDISASDVISAAKYDWKQIAINVVSSGRELRINSGKNQIVKLAKGKMKNALRTFNNNFSGDLYGSASLSNQIDGLQKIVADAPASGTVGGIAEATNTWWKNQFFNCSTESVTASASTIENSIMLPLWLDLDRGVDDQPDLIIAGNTYYQYFEASQVSIKRYASASEADGGMVSLKYKGADVVFDSDSTLGATRMYMLNTEYLKLVVHKDADLTEVEGQRPINQDGVVVPVLWMGNLTCSNRNQQGVVVPS